LKLTKTFNLLKPAPNGTSDFMVFTIHCDRIFFKPESSE